MYFCLIAKVLPLKVVSDLLPITLSLNVRLMKLLLGVRDLKDELISALVTPLCRKACPLIPKISILEQ